MRCAIQTVCVDCVGVVQVGRRSVGAFASEETRPPALPRCSVRPQSERFRRPHLRLEVPKCVPGFECSRCRGSVSKSDGRDCGWKHVKVHWVQNDDTR